MTSRSTSATAIDMRQACHEWATPRHPAPRFSVLSRVNRREEQSVSELVPSRYGREDRRVGRDLARVEGETRLAQTRIGRVADIQAVRVNSLAYVGRQALH